MTFEEKRAWNGLVVTVVTCGVYVWVILGRVDGGELDEVAYRGALLWTIRVSIAASIVLEALAGGGLKDARKKDARDRQIDRYGEYIGHWVLVGGGVAVLAMALAEWDHFWIANVIYLGFTLSAVLAAVVKIVAYRRGFPPW